MDLSEGKLVLGILCVGVVQRRNFSSDAAAQAKDVRLPAHFTLSDDKI